MKDSCSTLQVERYVCRDLSEAESMVVKAHIDTCSACAAHMQQLEQQHQSFLALHPFAKFTNAHAPLVSSRRFHCNWSRLFAPSFIPVYSMLIIALIVLPRLLPQNNSVVVRFKGQETISCLVMRKGSIQKNSPDFTYQAGDRVQVTYSSGPSRYLALLSVDVSGTVSFYQPNETSDTCSIPIQGKTGKLFPTSIILDNSPGSELVIALFSQTPLLTSSVAAWVDQCLSANPDPVALQKVIGSKADALSATAATLLLHKE